MDRIVVGVNGSPASTAAAVWAAAEAAMRNIELTIVHVLAASSTTCTQTESFVAKSFGGVSSAVAQASRFPVIVARGKPARQPDTIGDGRKIRGPGAVH